MTWLARRYSPEQLIEWAARREGSRAYYAAQFHKVFGVSLEEAWAQWIADERTFQQANLAAEYPEFAVQHEEGLVVPVVDVDGASVAAPGEVVGQGEGPAGVCAADAHLGQGTQEPDGRLGVRVGDNAACHGDNRFGHGEAPPKVDYILRTQGRCG